MLPRGEDASAAPDARPAPRLLYLSNGNIPSRWAHTVQIMRMSEALAQLVPGFELVIAESLQDRLAPRLDLWDWYGVEQRFPVRRLPLWLWRRSPLFESVNVTRFSLVAPRVAARAGPALVWTRSFPIADACLRRALPVLFERHTETPAKWKRQLARIASAPSLRGVVTLSESSCALLAAEGIPREKLAAFPSAVPLLPTRDRGAARRELGFADAERIALYAGRLSEHKGLPTLLAAARLLPRVRFVVLGGDAADVARWRARGGTNVELRGFVASSRIPLFLAAADVGLFTSSASDPLARAASPLKVYEYVGAGLPVVASAIPAVQGWLHDGENAFLFAPDDAGDLARAISRALADPGLAARVAARARAANEGNTWPDRARGILARVAPELLAAPSPSAPRA
jgi:glycosyltransferase involved in cell wall biosynthesis